MNQEIKYVKCTEGSSYYEYNKPGRVYRVAEYDKNTEVLTLYIEDDSKLKSISGINFDSPNLTNSTDYVIATEQEFLDQNPKNCQSISRSALGEIRPHVCTKWQSRIDAAVDADRFAQIINVPVDVLLEAYDQADSNQLDMLNNWFTEPVKESKFNIAALQNPDVTGHVIFTNSQAKAAGFVDNRFMEVRNSDMDGYGGKAFWLDSRYGWELKKADGGGMLLVPTLKR
jgi:hypothetical protein